MHDQAAADNGLGVAGVDVLAAFRAHDPDADAVTARLVQQVHRRAGRPVHWLPQFISAT